MQHLFGGIGTAVQVTALVQKELEEDIAAMTNKDLTKALKKSEGDHFVIFRAERAAEKKEEWERILRMGCY